MEADEPAHAPDFVHDERQKCTLIGPGSEFTGAFCFVTYAHVTGNSALTLEALGPQLAAFSK